MNKCLVLKRSLTSKTLRVQICVIFLDERSNEIPSSAAEHSISLFALTMDLGLLSYRYDKFTFQFTVIRCCIIKIYTTDSMQPA